MKKGKVELKMSTVKNSGDSDTWEIDEFNYFGWNRKRFTKKDLRDLKSLIDTVLGEEKKKCCSDCIAPMTDDCLNEKCKCHEEPSKKPSMTIGCMECGNNMVIE